MVPKILIFHTLRWPNAARLAVAFRAADCIVYALCRRGHELAKVSAVERIYDHSPFAPLRTLRTAIEEVDPDLIVLCDDPAVRQLLRLYRGLGDDAPARRIRSLVERSLGNPDAYRLVSRRSQLAVVARLAGVILPPTEIASTVGQVENLLARTGLPAVLKTDYSWGGRGVAVVADVGEAARAFRKLTGAHELARAFKSLIWEQDPVWLSRWLRRSKQTVTVQAFVHGRPANCAVACWEGEVIASISVEVLAALNPIGIATVVRVIESSEMVETAKNVVRALGISGFCGFDFVLDDATGRPLLLEINPRATQIDHLALGAGRDLPAALRARVASAPVRQTQAVTDRDTIALFPQEWRRDPASRFLLTAYHDVPNEQPELVRAYLGA